MSLNKKIYKDKFRIKGIDRVYSRTSMYPSFETYRSKGGVLTLGQYRQVLTSFFYVLGKSMIETGNVYDLGDIGNIGVFKRKTPKSGTYFDFAHFNKTGEKKWAKNKHSEGYKVFPKLIFMKQHFSPYPTTYFKFTRYNNRYLAKLLKTTGFLENYYEL